MNSKSKKLTAVAAALIVLCGSAAAESLPLVVFKTLADHPEIRAEISRQEARQQELKQAEAGYYPTVDLLAGVGYENSKNRYTKAAGEDDFIDLTRQEEAFIVTYNLFEGYGTSSNVDKYSARVRAASHHLHDLTEQTALQVARAYLRILRGEELVALSQETLAMYTDLYERVQSRSLSGVGRKSDIDHARGRVARARANLIDDEADLEDARDSYFRITGQRPGDLVRPENLEDRLPADLRLAVEQALENNPLIMARQADISAAQAQKRQAATGNYPHLDLVFEQSRGENLDGVEGVEEDYSLMLKLRYNLFNGGFDSARGKLAAAQLSETMDELAELQRRVTESTRLAWNALSAVNMQIPYLQQHVESITATRSAYYDQFGIGQRSLLDLLDSENEFYLARRSLLSAEYDRLVGGYQILATMGRLVDEFEAGIGAVQPRPE